MRDLKRLFGYLGPYRRDMFIGMALVFVETVFELIIPVLMAQLIDVGVASGDIPYISIQGRADGRSAPCLSLICRPALRPLCRPRRLWLGRAHPRGRVRPRAAVRLFQPRPFRDLLADHPHDHGRDRFAKRHQRRPAPAGAQPSDAVDGRGPLLFDERRAWRWSFSSAPPSWRWSLVLHPAQGRAHVRPSCSRRWTALNNVVQEGLTAIRAVKAFVRGEYEEEKFERVNAELMQTSQKTFHFAVLQPARLPVHACTPAVVLIMWFGGNMILGGEPAGGRADRLSQLCLAGDELPDDDLQRVPAADPLPGQRPPRSARCWTRTSPSPPRRTPSTEVPDGSIDFENVSFKYHADAQEYALSGVNLHIPAGADGGHPGRHRLRQDHPGAADSPPVRRDRGHGAASAAGMCGNTTCTTLRDAVGIVLQKNVLFSGTVRENLRWGDPDADDETLWAACRAACADEFLERHAQGPGYGSGPGRRQRLRRAEAAPVHRPHAAQAPQGADL